MLTSGLCLKISGTDYYNNVSNNLKSLKISKKKKRSKLYKLKIFSYQPSNLPIIYYTLVY